MKSCWQEQPEERPTFSELVTVISTALMGMVNYLDLNSLALSSRDSDTVSVLPTTTAQSDPVAHSNGDLSDHEHLTAVDLTSTSNTDTENHVESKM